MIRATSRVRFNMSRIRQLSRAAVSALEQTAEAVRTEVKQARVFPFDTGNLQGEATSADCSQSSQGKVTIVSDTPYARRLYYHPEYDFQTDENPNARGHWYEEWEKGGRHQEFAPKTFKEIYRREAGL